MANKRVNISIDEGMLNMLDFLAKQSHITRSQLIQRMAWSEWKLRRDMAEQDGDNFPSYSETITGEAIENQCFYSFYPYM